MKLLSLQARQVLPISLDEAWSFFSDPRNLSRITPPSMAFEVTSEVPDRIYAGLIITYRVRPLLRVPMQWVTEITHVREPHFFVDEQRFGPYRFWHHQHLFREVEGGVEVSDWVHYALPVGAPRALVDRLLVGPQLRRIFGFREQTLARMFGEPGHTG
jgi:ligand-binding SRPBCC domain-containing protein